MDDGRGFGSELVTLDFIPSLPRLIPPGNFSPISMLRKPGDAKARRGRG